MSGSGSQPFYQGSRFMVGHGFLGDMGKKFAIPILKFFGKHLAKTGLDVASDVILNDNKIKDSIKLNSKKNIRTAFEEAVPKIKRKIEQEGSGLPAKRRRRSNLPTKRKSKRKHTKKKTQKRKTKKYNSVTLGIAKKSLEKYPFFSL